MFSHVMVGSNDIERARAFYDAVLAVIGAAPGHANRAPEGSLRYFYRHHGNVFAVVEPRNGEAATVANGATLGFACDSPEAVDRFHDTAVAAGGVSIEDAPGWRETSVGRLYLAYVRDTDGHKLCAAYRPPAA